MAPILGPHTTPLLETHKQLLRALQQEPEQSRSRLAQRCHLSRPTVTSLCADLINAGLIIEGDPSVEGIGRPTLPLRLNPAALSLITVDIGGSSTRIALSDFQGNLLAHRIHPTPQADLRTLAATVKEDICELRRQVPAGPPGLAVIGVPGAVTPQQEVRLCPNVPALQGHATRQAFEAALGLPVILHNDVNLSALGEARKHNRDDLLYISIGTGLGAAFILDKQLHTGRRGFAGEIGNALVGAPGGPRALEDLISGVALSNAARELGVGEDAYALFDAAQHNQAAAVLLDQAAAALHSVISACVSLIDVELVVLAGGVGRRHDVWSARLDQLSADFPMAYTLEFTDDADTSVVEGAVVAALNVIPDYVGLPQKAITP